MLMIVHVVFFFNDTATTEIYTLSLHDALPIWSLVLGFNGGNANHAADGEEGGLMRVNPDTGESTVITRGMGMANGVVRGRSEEHTSELQSRQYLVCRLLLEKKKIR